MLQIVDAMTSTTAHGLPRIVSGKPLTVRLAWLSVLLLMTGLFFKGFYDFVVKLQTRQVTSSVDGNSLNFQFPDVYACYENPISGSYSATLDEASAAAINAQLNDSQVVMRRELSMLGYVGNAFMGAEMLFSLAHPQSISYRILIDALAHRNEQNIITSDVAYNTDYGMPEYAPLEAQIFYHPMYLRCLKWTLNSTWQQKIVQTGSSSGIVVTLVTDSAFQGLASSGHSIQKMVYARRTPIPVSDWSLNVADYNGPDRQAGVKVFLTPPGEYPSDFVSSFSLGPGKSHTVEIDMTQQVYKAGQFDCLSDPPDVQFVNPYDETPYKHSYSYSYCFYYEFHRQMQQLVNLSSDAGPLPWPLRGKKFALNLTGDPNFLVFFSDPSLEPLTSQIDVKSKETCKAKRLCSTLQYSATISSSDWPTQSSMMPFVSSSIKPVWMKAKSKNLSVPALDLVVNGNESIVSSYIRSNMLKVHFKPHRVLCDRMNFSIDYGLQDFISDVGGIMGIYLGMSLLTLCELFELIFDIALFGRKKARASSSKQASVSTIQQFKVSEESHLPPKESTKSLSISSISSVP
uniref:Acid phosphatase n=1 Tax=Macrostomum lignano TaxID=282301 RepID=A0A1I8GD92_9PLAT